MLWRHFFFSKETGIGKAETIAEDTLQIEESSRMEPVTPPVPHQEIKTVVLSEGKTLRLLALDLWGNREFWVYIYLANKDKIPNPNRVPSGTTLVLPEKSAYPINAADPHSVAKAKSLGDEVLRAF